MIGTTGTGLLERAMRLPASYKPMLTMHPHVWHERRHNPTADWARRLSSLEQLGLTVCTPDESWIPHLAAADIAIIDHGSLGLYFGLLGRPTITVPVRAEAINPASQIATLRACSPILNGPDQLHAVLDQAQASHDPRLVARRCGEIVSYPGEGARRTRQTLYRLIGLTEPTADMGVSLSSR